MKGNRNSFAKNWHKQVYQTSCSTLWSN